MIGTIASALHSTPEASNMVTARNTRAPVPPIPNTYTLLILIFDFRFLIKKEFGEDFCCPI
jgi:hypothetical protein